MQTNEFLSFNQLGTLYGLTFTVWLCMTALVAIQMIGEKYHKLIALVLAFAFAMLFVFLTDRYNAQAYVIAIPNAVMAFLGASGISNVTAAVQTKRQPALDAEAGLQATRQWWEKW